MIRYEQLDGSVGGVSTCPGSQKQTGHGPKHSAVVDPALSREVRLDDLPSNLSYSVERIETTVYLLFSHSLYD